MAKKKKETKAKESPAAGNAREMKVTGQQLMDTYRNDQAKLDGLQKKSKALQQVINEMVATLDSVKGIEKTANGENALISLGAGIYAEGKITNTKTLKSSLAGNVLVETDIAKVSTNLDEDLKKAGKEFANTQNEMRKTQINLQRVSQMLQKGQLMMQENQPAKEQASDVS